MKKIILLLAFCLSVGNLFAQDANADKLREEGDAAMTAKNYPEVVAKYSEYLKLTNYEDESRIFNCAFAAFTEAACFSIKTLAFSITSFSSNLANKI